MARLPEQIASLLIPMVGRPVLLPNVAVAEIVPWQQPEPVEGKPQWILGEVVWRGVKIPVLSLELMNDPELEDAAYGNRLAVLNGVGHSKRDFYAISVQGIPRLVRVFPDELGNEQDATEERAYDMHVQVSGERAVIPDLAAVERELDAVM